VIRGVVPQRPSLAAPQQQGKGDSGAAAENMQGAALRVNIAVRGSGRTWNGKKCGCR